MFLKGFLAVYDVLVALKRKKGFLAVLRESNVVLRCIGLIVSALIILIVRLSIMCFEGPVFTKFDNPAAFADNLLARVITNIHSILLYHIPTVVCF